MFLCKTCHKHGDPICEMEEFVQSYGKCENCGKIEPCTDCTWHHRAPKSELGKLAEYMKACRGEDSTKPC